MKNSKKNKIKRKLVDSTIGNLTKFARKAGQYRLLLSTSGNASIKIDEDFFLISSSGSELAELTKKQISVVNMKTGEWISRKMQSGVFPFPKFLSSRPPSIEKNLHREIYNIRKDSGAVLHFQSPYATLLGMEKGKLPSFDFIIEFPIYVGSVKKTPYAVPGSSELARLTAEIFAEESVTVAVMENHGQVAVGRDWKETIQRSIFFEFACKLVYLAKAGGYEIKYFTEEERIILENLGKG